MKTTRVYFKRLMEYKMTFDSPQDNGQADNNGIVLMIKLSYALKTIKLFISIINMTYFISVVWFIYAHYIYELYKDDGRENDTFFHINNLSTESEYHIYNLIKSIYFTFTTLSTVGFGDIKPTNKYEYLVSAFVMLGGNAVFTYIMTEFLSYLADWKLIDRDLEDGDELHFFINILQFFNGGVPINHEFKHEIENYFNYYWSNDKNAAIKTDFEIGILSQLPIEVQD